MPVNRKLSHSRTIACNGYKRSDGLWDIEAYLTDKKGFFVDTQERKIKAGEALHAMSLCVTVDNDFLIHDVEAIMSSTPYKLCPAIAASYKKLVGLRIGAGWTKKIKTLFSGTQGCTHLLELLTPIATVAYQTVVDGHYRTGKFEEGEHIFRQMVNGCYALSENSDVVRIMWPQLAASAITDK